MKRQTRIITLLVIDSVFFFVEIIIGPILCHRC
jgi:Co/Zn/Cd efflux system component